MLILVDLVRFSTIISFFINTHLCMWLSFACVPHITEETLTIPIKYNVGMPFFFKKNLFPEIAFSSCVNPPVIETNRYACFNACDRECDDLRQQSGKLHLQ